MKKSPISFLTIRSLRSLEVLGKLSTKSHNRASNLEEKKNLLVICLNLVLGSLKLLQSIPKAQEPITSVEKHSGKELHVLAALLNYY